MLNNPFPPEDVEAAANDEELQASKDSRREAEGELLAQYREQAVAAGAPESAEWIWFRSPDFTWASECGREGWLLYDRATATQHEWQLRVMS